jgi:hypothetical protein
MFGDNGHAHLRCAKLLAMTGGYTDALSSLADDPEDRYDVLFAIGDDMIAKGNLHDARKTLVQAWGSLKAHSGDVDIPSPVTIGETLARAGDLRGARFVAEEFAAPLREYKYPPDAYRVYACEIYCAILETRARSKSSSLKTQRYGHLCAALECSW